MNLLLEHFHELTHRPELAAKLKDLILQLAVQGKLVPQDPADEPASELLKRIQAEKQRLVEVGELKNDKPLPSIEQGEIPFEIPNSWRWVRLGKIQKFVNGFAFKSRDYQDSGIGIVRIGDIQNGAISKNSMKFISEEIATNLDKNLFVKKGDLLIAMSGATTGKLGFNKSDDVFLLNQRVGKIQVFIANIDFVYMYLSTKIEENLKSSAGSAIPNLSTFQINTIPLPLPPLNEQKRIVAKVESLLQKVDETVSHAEKTRQTRIYFGKAALQQLSNGISPGELRTGWRRIEQHFSDLFSTAANVQELRQTVLQLAVQGKLVPQDPSDEPASELLKRIQAEKQRLVEVGEIRKGKPIPAVGSDEISYVLPQGWIWCRLIEIGDINPRNKIDDEIEVSFIPMNLISEKYGVLPKSEIRSWVEIKQGFTHFAENDVAVAKITPCFENSKAAIMRSLSNGFGAGTTELHIFRGNPRYILPEYVYIYFKSPKFLDEGKINMTGTAGQKRLPKSYVAENPFPLPPLNEQKRIVAKVESLMQLCDRLEGKIGSSEQVAERLVDVLIQQKVARGK